MMKLKIGDTIAIRKPQPFLRKDFDPLGDLYVLDGVEHCIIQNQAQLEAAQREDVDGFLKAK